MQFSLKIYTTLLIRSCDVTYLQPQLTDFKATKNPAYTVDRLLGVLGLK